MARRLLWFTLLVTAATAVGGIGAPTAVGCSNETGVFWSDADGSGNIISAAYGAYAQITVSGHTLKCNDIGSYSNGQTVRVLINGEFGHYAEVGWAQKWCSSGSQCKRAFYEYNWGNNTHYQQEYAFSCLNPGTREAFEMLSPSVTLEGRWNGYMQCYSSGTWYLVDAFPDPYYTGFADNEAFQNSSLSGTSNEGDLNETHSALAWYDGSGFVSTSGSFYPQGITCRYDTSNRWNGNWLSGSSFNFTTASNGEGCSPAPAP